MKKFCLIVVLSLCLHCGRGHAMAVFDGSNLAQNVVSAQEAIRHTQNQIQMLTQQLNQYKRMLQDAMNPGSWEWGDIQDALDQLTNSMGSLDSFGGTAGGMNQFLDSFGSHSKYHESGEYYGTGNPSLYSGDLAGMDMQKQAADDMFNLIMDFETIESGVRNQLPASESWRASFGLAVTMVWLYTELLRILSYFQRS